MAITLGEAILYLRGDGSDLDKSLREADKQSRGIVGGLGDFANKGFSGLKNVVGAGILGGVGAVVAGFGALAVAFSDAEELARIQINAEKQLEAVLTSTGGAAGITSKEIKAMASSLQGVTNFGDEATIQGQSLLLTFTSIGKDVFPRATETMLDMSQALGQDMKGSAVQLGKALNDPILGVGALSKVGVSFTEQQKEQIKVLQESGDMMGAQTIILDELAKEFGGSARAMADPTIQMSNAFGDLKEIVGGVFVSVKNELAEKALPILGEVMGKTSELLKGLTEGGWGLSETLTFLADSLGLGAEKGQALANTITNAIDWVKAFKNTALEFMAPVLELIGSFVSWKDALIAVGLVAAAIVIPILGGIVAAALPVIAIGAALVAAVALVRNAWESDWGGIRTALTAWWTETGKPILDQLRVWLAENVPAALATLKQAVETILAAIKVFWEAHGADIMRIVKNAFDAISTSIGAVLQIISGLIKAVMMAINGDWAGAWDQLKNVASVWVNAMKNLLGLGLDSLKAILYIFFGGALTAISNFASNAGSAWHNGWSGMQTSASNVLNGIGSSISNGMGNGLNAIRNFATNAANAWQNAWSGMQSSASNLLSNIGTTIYNQFQQFVQTILGFGGQFEGAGRALIDSIGNGIRNAFSNLYNEFLAAAQALRNLLPGSEPKDPRSPLRGLADAGEALIANVQRGIGSTQLNINAAVPNLALAGAGAGGQAGAGGFAPISLTQNFYGQADGPTVQAAASDGIRAALRQRGR